MASFDIGNLAGAIKQQESGGKYTAVNPTSGALGAYQIMPFNLPIWSKAAGYEGITPAQFLANPKAQEDIARMQLGNYAAQYGDPATVARVWYGGPKAAHNSSIPGGKGYPTTGEYGDQVVSKLGGTTLTSTPGHPHTLTPPTAGAPYTPEAVAAANPAASPAPADTGNALQKLLTKPPPTKDAQGNEVEGKSPLQKLAGAVGDVAQKPAPEVAAMQPAMPAQDPDPGLAPASSQLFQTVQQAAMRPLTWSSRPYGWNAGQQLGTTLNATGYGNA